MCEQALKTFLHDMTKNMRTAASDRKSDLLNSAMTAMIKEKQGATA